MTTEIDFITIPAELRRMYITRVMIPWILFSVAVLIGTFYITSSWLSVLGMVVVLIGVDYLASRYVAPKLFDKFAAKVFRDMQ